MTIEKMSVVVEYTQLRCDICNSTDIIETHEGYVCRECAVVLKVQKLQYDRPYNKDVLHHARGLGRTKIGTSRERAFSPNSQKLKRLQSFNSHKSNEEHVEERAQSEISRILARLDLPDACKPSIMDKFRNVRLQLGPGTKFRSAEKLAAVLTIIGLKLKNISVNSQDVIEVSNLTKEEFRSFFTQVAHYIPEYASRNRQMYISQKLLEITHFFGLEMPFYFLAKNILFKLWESVKNTTDNVVAGLCAGITTLCNYRGDVKVNAICEFLGIKMSTIQFQVKHRIVEPYHIEGFKTLVRSADLIKRFMVKVGVIEDEQDIISEEEHEDGIIHVQLGNAQRVFDPLNDYYLFGLVDTESNNNEIIVGYMEVYNSPDNKHLKKGNIAKWFDLVLGEYYPAKGPPGIG